MIRFFLVALTVGLVLGAEKPKKDDGKKGAKGLEGTWEAVSLTVNGISFDHAKGYKVVFQVKTMTVKGNVEGSPVTTFKIDPKKKTNDFVLTEGAYKGKTQKGIYELKEGRLTICLAGTGKDRPTKFTSEKGSGHSLVVLKRAKSK
jgi:uncharacterized protein (TIGR03067 family)